VSVAGLLLRNAMVLFLPGWTPADGQVARGPEAVGQRALVLAGTLILVVVGLLPAAIVGSVVAWSLFVGVGPVALVVGALVGAALFAVEIYFALIALGRSFDRFDLSAT
jgi:ABC-2 type transport system permease protein